MKCDNRKVLERSKRATLCIRELKESLRQGSKRRSVVLYKTIGNIEKYVQLVQDMYEGSETMVRCAVGTTESFKVKVGLHQGTTLSPFLFPVIMDRLTDEVRRESSWTMLFADDIVICEENRRK